MEKEFVKNMVKGYIIVGSVFLVFAYGKYRIFDVPRFQLKLKRISQDTLQYQIRSNRMVRILPRHIPFTNFQIQTKYTLSPAKEYDLNFNICSPEWKPVLDVRSKDRIHTQAFLQENKSSFLTVIYAYDNLLGREVLVKKKLPLKKAVLEDLEEFMKEEEMK